jgi:DNA-binding NtrC family response regulator
MSSHPLRRRRVLIVDDEHLIADTLALILANAGFDTWTSYSGEEAMGVAHNIAFDAVLSDVMMSGMNGVQLAMRILEEYPDSRVLLFSGQAMTNDLVREAEARGFNFSVLSKPLHPSRLIKLLNEIFQDLGSSDGSGKGCESSPQQSL